MNTLKSYKEYFKDKGIMKEISLVSQPYFLDDDIIEMIDLTLLSDYGNKNVTEIVRNLPIESVAKVLYNRFNNKWEKINIVNNENIPLNDINMEVVENVVEDLEKIGLTNVNKNIEDVKKVSAYDSDITHVDNESSNTNIDKVDSNETGNNIINKTRTEKGDRGNITKTRRSIIYFYKEDFLYSTIIEDLKNTLTTLIY